MTEVGIRELKARLSYFVQLMQTGEIIAIKVRDQVVGYLSHDRPLRHTPKKRTERQALDRRIEQLKAEGFIVSGGRYRHYPFRPVQMTPGPTSTEILRKIRDEEI